MLSHTATQQSDQDSHRTTNWKEELLQHTAEAIGSQGEQLLLRSDQKSTLAILKGKQVRYSYLVRLR
jgi:hypothetical protein